VVDAARAYRRRELTGLRPDQEHVGSTAGGPR
jgi:hypothetical protein